VHRERTQVPLQGQRQHNNEIWNASINLARLAERLGTAHEDAGTRSCWSIVEIGSTTHVPSLSRSRSSVHSLLGIEPSPIVARADLCRGIGGQNPSERKNADRAPSHIFTSAKIENFRDCHFQRFQLNLLRRCTSVAQQWPVLRV